MRFSFSFSQNVFAFILYYYWPTAIKKGIEALRELQILGQGVAPSHEQSRKRLFFLHTFGAPGGPLDRSISPKINHFFPGDIPHPIRTSSKSIQNFLSYLTHKQTGEKHW